MSDVSVNVNQIDALRVYMRLKIRIANHIAAYT